MKPGESLPPPWRTRWRVRIGYPVVLFSFFFARPTPQALSAGAILAVLGIAVRTSAAGHLRKHEVLATAGPYAWTRNPLYFGSLLLCGGFLLATWSWIVTAVVALYLALFYPGVMHREEEELRAEYGSAFDEYSRRVPLFWPRLPKTTGRETFSWTQYRRNREYQALAGATLAFAIVFAEMYVRGH